MEALYDGQEFSRREAIVVHEVGAIEGEDPLWNKGKDALRTRSHPAELPTVKGAGPRNFLLLERNNKSKSSKSASRGSAKLVAKCGGVIQPVLALDP